MNDITDLIRVLSYAAKKRIELAKENKKNKIQDSLNDMVDQISKVLRADAARRKLKSKLRKKGKKNDFRS